jgi:hypothetical protein
MKRSILSLLFAGGLILFASQSCRKDSGNDVIDSDTIAAEDNATAEDIFNDVFALMDETARDQPALRTGGFRASCAQITVDSTSNPKVLTLDFGTGCTGNDGRTRSGKIIITFTGRYRDAGTVITHTFDNYYVNGNKVEGTKIVTNMGTNSAGHMYYKIEVKDAKITTANGVITWQSLREREWTAGENTASILDDEYNITGSASGTNRNGTHYTIQIDDLDPLHVKIGCRWIVSGKVSITPDGKSARTVNYGNGDCDNDATVLINGRSYAIKLK